MLLTSRDTSRISMRSRSPWPRNRPSSMGASGSSQRSQSSRLIVKGIRSWISASGPAASVVMIVQLSSGDASFGAFFGRHVDHRPAMNSGSPSAPYMKNGVFGAFLPDAASPLGRHSYQPSIGTRHRLPFAELRNAGELVTLSARALISSGPLVSGPPASVDLAHGGTRPQRIDRIRRVDSSSGSVCRLTTVLIVVVGATL